MKLTTWPELTEVVLLPTDVELVEPVAAEELPLPVPALELGGEVVESDGEDPDAVAVEPELVALPG
jgi:uncharacterized heparinase superfamily protein